MPRTLRLLAVLFVAAGCFGLYDMAAAFVAGEFSLSLTVLFLPAGLGLWFGREWARKLGIGLAVAEGALMALNVGIAALGVHLPQVPVYFGGADLTSWTPVFALYLVAITAAVVGLTVWAIRTLRSERTRQFIATS